MKGFVIQLSSNKYMNWELGTHLKFMQNFQIKSDSRLANKIASFDRNESGKSILDVVLTTPPRFHVPFWQSHILVYSFCSGPSLGICCFFLYFVIKM